MPAPMLKMRVGFDARWYNGSGVGTYVAQLLKALVRMQPGFGGPADSNGPSLELVIYEDPENPVPGLPDEGVIRIPLTTGKYSPASQIELRRRCRQDRLDLFHMPFYPIPLGASCPVVVTIHDLVPFLFRNENRLKNFLIRRGYRVAAARSRRILTVSNCTAEDIGNILGIRAEKISVVHNAVSPEDFNSTAKPDEIEDLQRKYGIHPPYVLAASTWNWQIKNLGNALKALSLAQSHFNTQFQTVIYGPPQGLEAAGGVNAWGSLKPVRTGQVTHEELAKLFRHARFLIFPALYEGFGLPVLEAMACGCAVITSNAGSLPEVVGNAALLFDPMDVAGMAKGAATLLCDSSKWQECREKGIKRAGDFSWRQAARDTVGVYHRALSNDEA